MKGETTGSVASLAALLRRHDRDRYQTALFAPAARREALFALYVFNYEIARVREAVTQPMLGQIRLQWWREVIDAAYAGAPPRQHEVALPLTAAIRAYGLPRGCFDRMIDAREADLAGEPPADLAALEQFVEASSSTVVELALAVLGTSGDGATESARHVGIAYALSGLLRAMPHHAAAGRCYIPADTAARAGIDPADYTAMRSTPALRAAVAEIAGAALRHLESGRGDAIPRAARPALLPAVIARRYLRRLRAAGSDPFAAELPAPDPLQIWRLTAAMLTGRL